MGMNRQHGQANRKTGTPRTMCIGRDTCTLRNVVDLYKDAADVVHPLIERHFELLLAQVQIRRCDDKGVAELCGVEFLHQAICYPSVQGFEANFDARAVGAIYL